MSRPVPSATSTLRVLRFLAVQRGPVSASRIASAVDLPRSSAYALLRAMRAEGFVTHFPDDRSWGLGVAAFEVGTGYARSQSLQRLARVPLARLVDTVGESAHLAVLHGREVLYVLEERAPGRPPLVTDVGVRLPAQLTASGRAILAALPASQVRALFPDRDAFVDRRGLGPPSPSALRRLLVDTRARGYATEDGEVTAGFASVAAAVTEHGWHPVASVAVTYESDAGLDPNRLVGEVRTTAADLSRRIGGASRPPGRPTVGAKSQL
jgi:DNA-binding IclR family transcriptional regulator